MEFLQKRPLKRPNERLKVQILLASQHLKGNPLLPVPLVDPDSFLHNPPFDQKRGIVNDTDIHRRDACRVFQFSFYGQFPLESLIGGRGSARTSAISTSLVGRTVPRATEPST
jgi:hypothetical protein